jgi:hypothetical protein
LSELLGRYKEKPILNSASLEVEDFLFAPYVKNITARQKGREVDKFIKCNLNT